jgi:hypothetical protein
MTISMRKDLLPCTLLVAFWVYLFKDILTGSHLLFGHDFNAFYLGMKQFLFTEIHESNSIPFWNPYILGGMPFWAHFESTIFYPLGFLFWVLPPGKAYGYTMFLHLVLAALSMYALARSWSIGRTGSFLAGAVFSCNGFVMSLLYLGQLSPVQSYPWLPLVILFLHKALSKGAYRYALSAGGLWGIQILAGAPQDAFYTYLTALLLGIVFTFRPSRGVHFLQPMICLLVLFLAGVGLAAIQVLPGLELIQESVRSSLDSFQDVTSRSLPPEGMITALMPRFFWDPGTNFTWLGNMPFSMPQENLYTGILPLFLLLFLPLLRFRDNRLAVVTVALAVLGLLLAMGYHTPLYKIVYHFPGFDRFRSPTRIIVLWVFAVALLAGKGMDLLPSYRASRAKSAALLSILIGLVFLNILFFLDRSMLMKLFSPLILHDAVPNMMSEAERMIEGEFHRFVLFSGAVCLLSLFTIRGSLLARIGPGILCGLLLIDLAVTNGRSIQYDDRFVGKITAEKIDLETVTGKDKVPYRIGAFANSLGPNFEMGMALQTVGGFTALIPSRYYEYISHYSEGALPRGWQYCFYGRHSQTVLMDLLNVKYEIQRPSRMIFVRESCLPRVFIVPECVVMPRDDVLRFLSHPDFDPTRTVILESGNCDLSLQKAGRSWPLKHAEAEVLSYRPDEIRIRVNSPSPGYLFLSENHYPGWKAYVDQTPVRILRGNYLFRVIPIQEGEHLIDMQFRPLSIKVGIGVTIGTLLFLFIILPINRRNKRGFH